MHLRSPACPASKTAETKQLLHWLLLSPMTWEIGISHKTTTGPAVSSHGLHVSFIYLTIGFVLFLIMLT